MMCGEQKPGSDVKFVIDEARKVLQVSGPGRALSYLEVNIKKYLDRKDRVAAKLFLAEADAIIRTNKPIGDLIYDVLRIVAHHYAVGQTVIAEDIFDRLTRESENIKDD